MSTLAVPTDRRSGRDQVVALVHAGAVDEERGVAAASALLDALGLDLSLPGMTETPRRMVRMFAELLTPLPVHPTTFPNEAGYDELVVVKDIPFVSLCEHHLVPFRGVAHVGYLPADRLVGLSKLPRLVQALARRPQVQERLTAQVADWIGHHVAPRGAGAVIDAEHLCMSIRGVRAAGARTVTSSLTGVLREDAAARQEFLHLTGTTT